MIYRLVFLSGASKGLRLTVEPSPMVVGTGEDCDIRCDDAEMARRHAVIEQKPDGLWISDLGSMNKILVNSRELHKSRLKHGDLIELGRTRFLVQAVVQAEFDGPALPRQKRRRLRAVLAICALAVTAFVCWRVRLASESVPRPPGGSPDTTAPDEFPIVGSGTVHDVVSATQVVATIETVPEAIPVAVEATPAATTAVDTAQSEEFQALLRELQGLKAMVTSMVATVKPDAPVTSVPPAGVVSRLPDGPVLEPIAVNVKPVVPEEAPIESEPPHRVVDVRVGTVEQQRFPASDDFDEMRILRIGLTWQPDNAPTARDGVWLHVSFFEQTPDKQDVVLSRVTTPRRLEIPDDAWAQGTSTVVTASYVVPKGGRDATGAVGSFHGYVIRVCQHGEAMDTYARPPTLLLLEHTAPALLRDAASLRDNPE